MFFYVLPLFNQKSSSLFLKGRGTSFTIQTKTRGTTLVDGHSTALSIRSCFGNPPDAYLAYFLLFREGIYPFFGVGSGARAVRENLRPHARNALSKYASSLSRVRGRHVPITAIPYQRHTRNVISSSCRQDRHRSHLPDTESSSSMDILARFRPLSIDASPGGSAANRTAKSDHLSPRTPSSRLTAQATKKPAKSAMPATPDEHPPPPPEESSPGGRAVPVDVVNALIQALISVKSSPS